MCGVGDRSLGGGTETTFAIAEAHATSLGPRGRAAKNRAALVLTSELEIPEQRARSSPGHRRMWPQDPQPEMREKALRPCGSHGGLRPSPQPRCGWAGRVGERLANPCSVGSPVTWKCFRSQECREERRPRRRGGGAEGSGSAPRGSCGRA